MRKFFCILFLGLGAVRAHATVNDYSPFVAGQGPPLFKLTAWTNQLQLSGEEKVRHYEFAASAQAYPRLTLDWDEKAFVYRSQLKRSDGTVSFSANVDSPPEGAVLFCADLNGDKIPDYVIETLTGANGLGPDHRLTFLLSTPKGYRIQSLVGNGVDPAKDFLIFKKDGLPIFLMTLLIEGEKGRDGKVHNYWVHNLIGFDGGNLVSANSQDSRFPMWIYYTLKPSHTQEDQLTPQQRTRLWALSDPETLEFLTQDQARASPVTPAQVAPSL